MYKAEIFDNSRPSMVYLIFIEGNVCFLVEKENKGFDFPLKKEI
jgi:hypothetical protein